MEAILIMLSVVIAWCEDNIIGFARPLEAKA